MGNTKFNPPKMGLWLLKKITIEEDKFSVMGDIEEVYQNIVLNKGKTKAWFWYSHQIVISTPPFINYIVYWRFLMIKNYLKIAFRNLCKQKVYSLINISGLAVGLALFILAMLYAEFNLSFDKFHKDAKRIFLLTRVTQNDRHGTWVPGPMKKAILDEISEIQEVTRYEFGGEQAVKYEDKKFNEVYIRYVDESFLSIFSFEMIAGNPETALSEPNRLVITESIAEKYFGTENPIGKTLVFEDSLSLIITGITKDVPKNSSIQYNFLISHTTLGHSEDWDHWCITFLRLPEGVSASHFDDQLLAITQKYIGEPRNRPKRIYLFPLTQIYFRPQYLSTNFRMTPKEQFYIIIGTASALLLVVCMNFMNLATARYMNRAREVGLRKVVGAQRHQLIKQFLGESSLIAFFSLPLGLILYLLIRSSFQTFMRLDLDLFVWSNPRLMIFTLSVTFIIGIVSGSYPAFFLSAFRPINVLRGNLQKGKKSSLMRKILVVSQFVLSIVLIVFAIVVDRQFDHLLSVDLGYDKRDVIIVEFHRKAVEKIDVLKNQLLDHPDIISVTRSYVRPFDWGSDIPGTKVIPEGMSEESAIRLQLYPAPFDFIETLNLTLISGRSFSRDFNEENRCIISETTASMLPWDDPLGRQVSVDNWTAIIIGVVKDFHFKHVFHEMSPTLLYNQERNSRLLLVKTTSNKIPSAIQFIQNRWNSIMPDLPIETTILEDEFVEAFKNSVRGGELVSLFSIIAIFFSCLGLLGLASFTAERKTKEIAIRKVLGATIPGLTGMLIIKFLLLVTLSNLIAWPTAYFVSHWFLNWAWVYQISLGIDIFVIATLLSLITAIIAVISQSLRAATANPVDSLRIE